MPIELIIAVVMMLIGITGMIVAVYSASQNKHRGEVEDTSLTTAKIERIAVTAENIQSDIIEMKLTLRRSEERTDSLIERAVVAEQSLKTAWKHIEVLEGKCEHAG